MDGDRSVPCSSSLVHSETSPSPLLTQSRAQYRIHAPVARIRETIINALHYSTDPRLEKRAGKLGMCCIAPRVFVGAGCLPSCSPGRCRDRLCPTCSAFRAGSLRGRLKKLLRSANAVRFITLTMAPVAKGLQACVDAVLENFRRLRADPEWKEHVNGGAWVLEAKRTRAGTHWHVHIHILADGHFWDQGCLQDAWSRAVGKESIADIRALHDRDGAAGYLAKYLAKGCDADTWTHDEICEFAIDMHGRRTLGTFGTWHKAKLADLDAEPAKPAKPELDLSFLVVDEVLTADEDLRHSVVPLLSRLSTTWNRLLAPHRNAIEWTDAPLEAKEFASLTNVLIEIRDILLAQPLTPEQIRQEAKRLREQKRKLCNARQRALRWEANGTAEDR